MEKFIKWFIFTVILTLIPLLFSYLKFLIQHDTEKIFYFASNGELYLISVCISAAAIGDLLSSSDHFKIAKILSGGLCVILLILCSFLFAEINSNTIEYLRKNYSIILEISLWMYGVTIVSGGSSVILSEI